MTAVGKSMHEMRVALGKGLINFIGNCYRTQWQVASGNAFCGGHNIGFDPEMFHREPFTSTAETADDLIGEHPDIELAFPELWMPSTNVLQHILNKAIWSHSEWQLVQAQRAACRYVRTAKHDEAIAMLQEHGVVIVTGIPGIGKTTLMKCFAGLIVPDSGTVSLNNTDILQMKRKQVAKQVGMMQQHTVYVFDATVLQTVLTGRHPHLGNWQQESKTDHDMALKAIEQVGLRVETT